MKRTSITVFAAVTIICVSASTSFTTGSADEEGSPIFGVQIPAGYRDWMLISVAHEEANLNNFAAAGK